MATDATKSGRTGKSAPGKVAGDAPAGGAAAAASSPPKPTSGPAKPQAASAAKRAAVPKPKRAALAGPRAAPAKVPAKAPPKASSPARAASPVPAVARKDKPAPAKKGGGMLSAFGKAGEKLLVRMRGEKTATPAEIIRQIARGPQGPKVVAAFDFDGTLVGGLTGAMLMQERLRRKDISRAEILETVGVSVKAMAKLVDAKEVITRGLEQWAGKSEADMEELGEHLFAQKIQDSVFPEMRQILDAHRRAGHTIVVATAATRFQVERTVESLGIEHLLCTHLEVSEGTLTGKLVGDSLFGPGKIAAIERFIAERGIPLADTHFYGDGDEEVGLMKAVGFPHPVNPGRKLTEAARENRWAVLRLTSRGGNKPMHFVRGIGGMMSIIPILQAGLAVGLMTRDKRAVANLIVPTWIKAQLDTAGVKLSVSGRKYLKARRPAVFIFNHRNNYDGSFVALLLGSDFASVGKKEIGQNPIGKLAAAIMPTVFVERGSGDPSKAAEMLQPVVDAVAEGYSVMLAPEGTRVKGYPNSVGPFKKGAFHIAMAAGIPIVPVIIRNALDVASRDGAMRPGTVDVAVLPPIPIEDWTVDNMAAKIADIRQAYIDTLADWPPPDDDES